MAQSYIHGFNVVFVANLLHNVFMIRFCLTCSLCLMVLEEFLQQIIAYRREYQRWSPRGRPRGQILKSLALASRTDFEVLGLGLEASSPRKLACPRLEDSTIF